MIRTIAIAPLAEADIAKIWHYTAAEHGLDAADAYIRDLDQTLQMVCEFPEIGADSSQIRRGYRRIGSGSHLIYYIPGHTEIYVVRILHGKQYAHGQLR